MQPTPHSNIQQTGTRIVRLIQAGLGIWREDRFGQEAIVIQFTNEPRAGGGNAPALVKASLLYRDEQNELLRIAGDWVDEAADMVEFRVDETHRLIVGVLLGQQLVAIAKRRVREDINTDRIEVDQHPLRVFQQGTVRVRLTDVHTYYVLYEGDFEIGLNPLRIRSSGDKQIVENGRQISAEESQDHKFARLAIEEARKSVPENDGRPHPMVGAVVVKNGNVLATAHRGEARGNHAEYIALERRLTDAAVAGATVYTTLEPCTTRNHPKIPCVERLIERKVGRVVIGMLDPDPRITGGGQRRLRNANIITDFFPHDLMAEVEELNREFTRKVESASRIADSPAPPVEPQAVGAPHRATDVVDKWVSLGYEHKCGVAKTLDEQGFDLGWVSADKEVEKVEFEGWEYVLVDQSDGSRARLKIHDHPAVGGYLVLLKRRKPPR